MNANNKLACRSWINYDVTAQAIGATPISISWSSPESSDTENECHHNMKKNKRCRWFDANSPSKFNTDSYKEYPSSPIILKNELTLSPIISKSDRLNKPLSPIIDKKNYLRRVRFKLKHRYKFNIENSFTSALQRSEIKIDSSPDYHLEKSQLSCDIGVLLSQDSSQISPDSSMCYYIPQERVKSRKYKKAGLAERLQKTLNLQRSRVSIWKYEYENNNLCGVLNTKDNELIVLVKEVIEEYGNKIIFCDNYKLDFLGNIETVMLICANNFVWEEAEIYKIYLPYEMRKVKYRSSFFTCYFNISKYIKSSEPHMHTN